MQFTKPTFVNAKDVEVSTIVYILYDRALSDRTRGWALWLAMSQTIIR